MNKRKLSDQKKRLFYSQLRELLHAGLSFTSSFSILVDGTDGNEREVYQALFDEVVSGHSLWEAMKSRKEYGELDYGVVRVGEESGNLMESLSFLADYYERKESQRRTLVSALSYPVIIMLVAMVVMTFMLLVVVPMFEQVYARMGGELPSLTRWVIRFGDSFPTIIVFLSIMVAIMGSIYHFYRDSQWLQVLWARVVLAMPVLGTLVRKMQLSRFCRILNLLVRAEVPLLQAISLVGDIMTLYPFKESLMEVSRQVKEGSSMSSVLSGYPGLYDKKFLALVKVGEETNTLDSILTSLSDDYTEELNYQIKQLNNLLEPALIIMIGSVVAFVLISMYLPMFKLGTTLQ